MTAPIALRHRLRDSRDGNIAIMFGLLLLPVVVTVGVGVDVARSYAAKIRFDAAFDNAASALRASPATDSAAMIERRLQSYLDLAYRSSASGEHVALRLTDPRQPVVTMTASASASTTIMQLVGVNSMSLHAAARVARLYPPGSDETQGDTAQQGGDSDRLEEQRHRRESRPGLWLDSRIRSR